MRKTRRSEAGTGGAAIRRGAPDGGRRGPRRSLSLEQLADAGVRLADAQGLAGVSMERVAKVLGVTTMAPYRYVASKGELVDLMVERGLGPPPVLEGETWRARLTAWATALHALFCRHPWALEATGRLRVMGPCELAWLEAGMQTLLPTALSPAECHGACLAVLGQVRTSAQFSAPQHHGLTGADWAVATRTMLKGRDDFPQLQALLRAGPPRVGLEHSLEWVLDGITARIAHSSARGGNRGRRGRASS
jgi:AcrR family transcriptional regulator